MVRILRFDRLLDDYVRDVFEGLDGGFSRGRGGYVCGVDSFSSDAFGAGLEKRVLSEAGSPRRGDYCFIVGDCDPSMNILLELGEVDVPPFRYFLSERDLLIDEGAFNRRAESVFNRIFRRQAAVPPGVFAVRHSRLGADAMCRLLLFVLGSVNCAAPDGGRPSCVTSSNDVICGAVPGKSRLNRMPEMRAIAESVKQYVGGCLGAGWEA